MESRSVPTIPRGEFDTWPSVLAPSSRFVLGIECLQSRQQLVDTWIQLIGIGLAEADAASPIEDEERPCAHPLRLSKDAIAAGDLAARLEVCQQWEAYVSIARERSMTVNMINGNAYQSRAELLEVVQK